MRDEQRGKRNLLAALLSELPAPGNSVRHRNLRPFGYCKILDYLPIDHRLLETCQGPGLTMKAEERFLCVKRV